jgi:hypothetical protein
MWSAHRATRELARRADVAHQQRGCTIRRTRRARRSTYATRNGGRATGAAEPCGGLSGPPGASSGHGLCDLGRWRRGRARQRRAASNYRSSADIEYELPTSSGDIVLFRSRFMPLHGEASGASEPIDRMLVHRESSVERKH